MLGTLLGFAILGASCGAQRTVEMQVDWPVYETVDALFERADLVVEVSVPRSGRIKEVSDGPELDSTTVYTVFETVVSRVFKGSATPGKQVEVKQLGGEFDGVNHRADQVVYLTPDQSYLLFLETYPDSPASLLNAHQAQYPLDAAGAAVSLPDNKIVVTGPDLARLSGTG